jgi:formamidopyrimidine-DNA glycosylase
MEVLTGSEFLGSEAHGKQMLFRFSKGGWLGLHLGMTGTLRAEGSDFQPGKHDHLVLYQPRRALVFWDPRQFGRVQFHVGKSAPAWWTSLPAAWNSPAFTLASVRGFLQRHAKLPIKATLLLQEGFPGIGNWMADEILWRAKLSPRRATRDVSIELLERLFKAIRFVCSGAMKHISPAFDDPPKGWLFNERWKQGGICPIHDVTLKRETVGGRTTAWCPRCQE